jgi:ditrans,polycis-polyprenyl diphosphate synthase
MPLLQLFQWVAESALANIRGFLLNALRRGPIPKHIAFIMDGNRRYAKEHGLAIAEGHRAGIIALMKVSFHARYLLSTELTVVRRH